MIERAATVYENDQDRTVRLAQAAGKVGLNVCVFCSANQLPPKFTEPAEAFASLIASHGHNLVWGGSDVGLMKIMADGAQRGGAKLIGVSVDFLKANAHPGADEMFIARDLGERKAKMVEYSDVIAVLVGGIGTLDEISEVIELKRHGHHELPVVVLNTENFYEGLQTQLQRMDDEGMLTLPLNRLVNFAETPEQAISYIDQFKPATLL